MRESDIEKYLVKRVKELGGEVRKVKWVGRQGAPDRLVMLPAPAEFRWCRGVEGLEHRGFTPSEFSGRKFCTKCGTSEADANARTIWVELKAPGKAATFPANAHERKQQREHERLRKMGQRVEVVDSFEGVDRVLS